MDSEFQLRAQLNELNGKYEALHLELEAAEKLKDEEKIKSLLSRIQDVAYRQNRLKEQLNGAG